MHWQLQERRGTISICKKLKSFFIDYIAGRPEQTVNHASLNRQVQLGQQPGCSFWHERKKSWGPVDQFSHKCQVWPGVWNFASQLWALPGPYLWFRHQSSQCKDRLDQQRHHPTWLMEDDQEPNLEWRWPQGDLEEKLSAEKYEALHTIQWPKEHRKFIRHDSGKCQNLGVWLTSCCGCFWTSSPWVWVGYYAKANRDPQWIEELRSGESAREVPGKLWGSRPPQPLETYFSGLLVLRLRHWVLRLQIINQILGLLHLFHFLSLALDMLLWPFVSSWILLIR